ncbi:MAG TPA: DegT/DnrJ/EryC1/StrS family aminotransferase [Chthonomonadales bacterium]|nr:DegT/DnrJ/EryC1/StrS family aminotransferase [Chthonomonadales bacterium]
MRVALADLVQQYESIRVDVDAAIRDVLTSGRFILGPVVSDLEERVAAFCGARYGVAVNSGTDALLLSQVAHGIGAGDEVITSPFTFVATVEAIANVGATPVFADIDPRTFNLCPDSAAARVTERTRAVMPVDLFGQMADRTAFARMADRHGLCMIWDAAQAIGARFEDLPLGAFGDSTTLSFFPTKNLGAYGDGGLVLTDDEGVRDRLVRIRFHGSGGGYHYESVGYCSRLDALQAAVLRVKLGHLSAWNEARRSHAALYGELLKDCGVCLPYSDPRAYHTYHQYTLRHPRRDDLKRALSDHGVDSGVYYPAPLHVQKAYAHLGYREGDFPEAERAAREVLSIPVHPGISEEQISYVAEIIARHAS